MKCEWCRKEVSDNEVCKLYSGPRNNTISHCFCSPKCRKEAKGECLWDDEYEYK